MLASLSFSRTSKMAYMFRTAWTSILLLVSLSHQAQDCGTLSTKTPDVLEGHGIWVEFEPVEDNTPKILLHETLSKDRVKLFDRQQSTLNQKATEIRVGSKFVYTIASVQSGRYFVICQNGRYSNELNVEAMRHSEGTEQGYCGNLTVISHNNTVGSTTQLLLIPNEPEDSIEWFHWTGSKYQLLDKHNRYKYEETVSNSKQMFVFKISRSDKNDEGFYKAHCGGGEYSNNVFLDIVVSSPAKPRLAELQNFAKCKNCIKAFPGKDVLVTCRSEGGSPPVNISIYKDGEFKVSQTSQATVAADLVFRFKATPDYEWAVIICNVSNAATDVPLSTSAIVYFYQAPSDPVFSTSSILEGPESEVVCSTFGGRPAPYIKFVYNNTFEKFTNTRTYDEITLTYNVTSAFQKTLHRWDNNRDFECCVEHDLNSGKLSCKAVRLDVRYLPNSVHLLEQSRYPLLSGYTKITLLCTADESNPVSNISWSGIENMRSKLSVAEEQAGQYGGSLVSQVMTIWAGREHFGTEVSCDVTNTDFPRFHVSSGFIINITYPPFITISAYSNTRLAIGQEVKIVCSVDSNPPANVTWWTKKPRNISQDVTTLQKAVLYFWSAQIEDSGTYFCTAENNRGQSTQNISLVVNDTLTYEKGSLAEPSDSTPVVAGVLGAVVVLALVIAIIVIVLRKRKNLNDVKTTDHSPQQGDVSNRPAENRDDHVYSNTSDSEPAEYASVIPKSQRQNVTNVNNTKTEASPQPKELVYAELDLDTPNTTTVFKKPEAEQTEYVELDFKNKT